MSSGLTTPLTVSLHHGRGEVTSVGFRRVSLCSISAESFGIAGSSFNEAFSNRHTYVTYTPRWNSRNLREYLKFSGSELAVIYSRILQTKTKNIRIY